MKEKFKPQRRRDTENIRKFSNDKITASAKDQSQISNPKSQILFGVLPVLEALRAGNRRMEKILIAENTHEKRLNEIIVLARENRIVFQKVPRQNLSKLVEPGANHQGVIAFVASADYYESEKLLAEISQKIEAGEKPLIVILDGVEDPRNLGAILRTVECAGVDGVFIPERRAVGLNETVAKSSAGATEYVKVAKVTNLNRLIEDLKERNIWVVGTSVETDKSYTDWDWNQPTALVMGSEGKGLHRLVAENCDMLIKIPMQGKIESLNVSVATGVILFEAFRQRALIN
ncbi:MAG TPA: 23S rRNA (guanosine(2251)-2'-O)-methyltransferase RlmB [Pyrinomonadaceae bacterium]|nr:23S rRNA (guanosine(2251)-2'-O)-methyltransferase RlmB [Pyrinomonadaceae bacterium]